MRKYVCEDGTIFVKAVDTVVWVDDFIKFLEQHRGKTISNSAVENLGFRINEEHIWCDEIEYLLDTIGDNDLYEEACAALKV